MIGMPDASAQLLVFRHTFDDPKLANSIEKVRRPREMEINTAGLCNSDRIEVNSGV